MGEQVPEEEEVARDALSSTEEKGGGKKDVSDHSSMKAAKHPGQLPHSDTHGIMTISNGLSDLAPLPLPVVLGAGVTGWVLLNLDCKLGRETAMPIALRPRLALPVPLPLPVTVPVAPLIPAEFDPEP